MKLTSLLLCMLLSSVSAFADSAPNCLQAGKPLAINNDQVLQWKASTQNQFKARGHIQGTLVKSYADQTRHHHFEVQIGAAAQDTIEIIYNDEFGALPDMHAGSQIEACGDYITANKRTGPLPPSPDGAILHWVHKATGGGHPPGYVIVDGTVCGQD